MRHPSRRRSATVAVEDGTDKLRLSVARGATHHGPRARPPTLLGAAIMCHGLALVGKTPVAPGVYNALTIQFPIVAWN